MQRVGIRVKLPRLSHRYDHQGCQPWVRYASNKPSIDDKPTKIQYKSNFGTSFKIWLNELFNYDDGDTISQNKFLGYVLPYYEPTELVGCRDKNIRAFNVRTPLKEYEEPDLGDANQWFINEIRVEKGDVETTNVDHRHMVMLHGYGASAGWFYKNLDGIIRNSENVPNLTIHSLDMVGFGLSGRPYVRFENDLRTKGTLEIKTQGIKWGKFSTCETCGGHLDGKKSKNLHLCYCEADEEKMRAGESEGNAMVIVKKSDVVDYVRNHKELINEVEEVYVESLEKWRAKNNIEKFDLVAHSLGGYLGMSYCLKYPERVGKIAMVSPGGVERSPFAITNPEYQKIYQNNDRIGDFKFKVSNHVQDYGFLGRYGFINKTFRDVWNMRFSVLTFLRWAGPFGPKMLSDRNADKLTRSGNIKDLKEIDLFLKYIYSCSVRTSFSETSIMRLFDATVVGKIPMLDKLQENGSVLKDKKMMWVYGEHDFMYRDCGVESINIMNKHITNLDGEQKLVVIKNAGHNMYLDNSKDFDQAVIDFFQY